MKWLFRMEHVGEMMWKNKNKVVKLYNEKVQNPVVNTKQSCGISKADFDIILDELNRIGIEV